MIDHRTLITRSYRGCKHSLDLFDGRRGAIVNLMFLPGLVEDYRALAELALTTDYVGIAHIRMVAKGII
jgi:hypothetical protein